MAKPLVDEHLDSSGEGEPSRPGRRFFLKSVSASSLAAAGGSLAPMAAAHAENHLAEAAAAPPEAGTIPIQLMVNGVPRKLHVAPNAVLLDVLRDTLALTGTKKGCDHGQCGACTLHVNGVAINSCLSLAVMHDGDAITTIEGLGTPDRLHPIQQAFWEHDAYQCGYCTSGQMMSAVALLKDGHVGHDDHSVREAMSGNICRCAAYENILSAIQSTRGKIEGNA
jgi:xanthine dehydrogenase YagT iron-sulfur-binding subunit